MPNPRGIPYATQLGQSSCFFIQFKKQITYSSCSKKTIGFPTYIDHQIKFIIKTTTITYLETSDDNGYIVNLKITYEEDLGYQSVASLYLVHNNNKLEIIKMTK